MAFRPPIPTLVPAPNNTFGIRGWSVFPPGYWKGHYFSPARVAGIVRTFKRLKAVLPSFSPKVRLGHDSQQRLARSLGLPNAGRVTDVRLNAKGGLELDCDGIPRTALAWNPKANRAEVVDLLDKFRSGEIDGGSIELKPRMPNPLDPRMWFTDVLDGIAVIGEEQPGNPLSDRPTDRLHFAAGSADALVLCFSDFTPEAPMNPTADGAGTAPATDPKAQIAAALGLDVNDPVIQSLTPEQIAAILPKLGGAAPPMQFSADVLQRLNALEAANTDLRAQLAGQQTNGMVTMSEAHRRIDECVKAGKLDPMLAEVKKEDAKALLGLPADRLVFSDGAHKGKARIAAFLEQLEARPADLMFSERVGEPEPAAEGGVLSDADRLDILARTPSGRKDVRHVQKLAAAK